MVTRWGVRRRGTKTNRCGRHFWRSATPSCDGCSMFFCLPIRSTVACFSLRVFPNRRTTLWYLRPLFQKQATFQYLPQKPVIRTFLCCRRQAHCSAHIHVGCIPQGHLIKKRWRQWGPVEGKRLMILSPFPPPFWTGDRRCKRPCLIARCLCSPSRCVVWRISTHIFESLRTKLRWLRLILPSQATFSIVPAKVNDENICLYSSTRLLFGWRSIQKLL